MTDRIPPKFDFTSDPSVSAFTVSPADFLAARTQHVGVCAGAFVFCRHTSRLLLLQRAATDSWPNRYEVPGGSIDADDISILHGVARELWEETGLLLRKVVRLVRWPRSSEDWEFKDELGGGTFFTSRGLRAVKYSFEVEVEEEGLELEEKKGLRVTLDPNEHQNFLWVTEEEARRKETAEGVKIEFSTKQQEETILEAFRMRGEDVKA